MSNNEKWTRDQITILEVCSDFAMTYYNCVASTREDAGLHLLSFLAGECNHMFCKRVAGNLKCELCDSDVEEQDTND